MNRSIIDEIADMRSEKGEYIRLMSVAISEGIEDVLNRIKEERGSKELDTIILETAVKCYDISNASFGDHFNPNHGEEQGAPF